MAIEYLSPQLAADYLNVSRPTIYRWISERKIPFYKPNNGRVFLKAKDLDAVMESWKVNPND